jgi:hypothetical protein
MTRDTKPTTPNCYEANPDGSLTMYFEDIEEDVAYSGENGKPDGTGNFNITITASGIQRLLYAGIDALHNAPGEGKAVRR